MEGTRSPLKRDALDWLWQPELLLVGWLSASFVLMTLSLLFYHMTRVASLEMSSFVSGLFAVGLIVCSVMLTCIAIFTYDKRTRTVMGITRLNEESSKDENAFRVIHTGVCVIIMIIQMGIVLTIARGTLLTDATHRRAPHSPQLEYSSRHSSYSAGGRQPASQPIFV